MGFYLEFSKQKIASMAQPISNRPSIVFAANRGFGLTSSRANLISRFLASNWHVVIATADDAESRSLENMGARLEPIVFNRGGLMLAADISCYFRLRSVYRKWRPVLVHHFNAKPVLFGSLAARQVLGSRVKVVNTITGLGQAFSDGGPSAKLAALGYRIAIPGSDLTVFQNRDDRALFLERNWVAESSARLIAGSGVDINRFTLVDRSNRDTNAPVIVMIARLLRQKGIPEFVQVAQEIRKRWPGARFLLAGEEEPRRPDAVTVDWLRGQADIEYLGRLDDVVPLLQQADLFLFPSYYREGVPRVVLEASAMGLPTVGFDVPGVREAIRDGETGYLVKNRDLATMTARVDELLDDPRLRLRMGRNARKLAEDCFDLRVIEERYFELYRELGPEINP